MHILCRPTVLLEKWEPIPYKKNIKQTFSLEGDQNTE